jgi:hypothetical protein
MLVSKIVIEELTSTKIPFGFYEDPSVKHRQEA